MTKLKAIRTSSLILSLLFCFLSTSCNETTKTTEHTHSYTQEVVSEKYLVSEANCTSPATYYYSCSCGEQGSETFTSGEKDPNNHTSYASWVITSTTHKKAYECCGKVLVEEEEHHGGVSTCNKLAVCEECSAEYGEYGDHVYEEVVDEKYLRSKATCIEPATYFYSCSCGEISPNSFTYGGVDPNNHEKEAEWVITSTTHKKVYSCCGVEEVKEAAHTGGSATETELAKCEVCNSTYGELLHVHNFNQEVAEDKYLRSEATCLAKATYYYSCECGEKGSETFEYGEVSSIHDFQETFTWSDGYSSCKVTLICSRDSSHKVSDEECIVTTTTSLYPNCEDDGEKTHSATYTYNGVTYEDKITEPINKNGHDWGEFIYTWNDDLSECSAKRICNTDSNHYEEETVSSSLVTTDATCENKGKHVYTVSFNLEGTTSQTKEVEISPLGHTYGDLSYKFNSDYTSCSATKICSTCKDEVTYNSTSVTSEVTQEQNCGKDEITKYSAIFESIASYSENVKTKDATLNHNYKGNTSKNISQSLCTVCGQWHDVSNEILKYELNSNNDGYIVSVDTTKLEQNPASKYEYTNVNGAITIPDTYNNLPIKEIKEKAFYNLVNVTSINIPSTVTSIGKRAFYKCKSLTSISIPDGVTTINEYTFYLCSSLSSITIPDNVTSIEQKSFYKCTSLKEIDLPSSLTTITNNLFEGCKNLEKVSIPSSVTSIEKEAFKSCDKLKCVDMSNTLISSIGEKAFQYCNSLSEVKFSSELTTIGKIAFSSGDNYTGDTEEACIFTSLDLSNTKLTSIGEAAFAYNTNLINIVLPSSLTSIGGYAFYNCNNSSLTSITFNGTKEQFEGVSKDTKWVCDTGIITVKCTDENITL